jgi:glycosyltransferase involved in cell wall biosynthesis
VVVTLTGPENDFYTLDPRVRRCALAMDRESASVGAAVRANLERLLAFRRVLVHERPDAAIAMMTSANVLLALAATGTRVAVRIGSERAHPPLLPLGRAWAALRRVTYGRLSRVVAQTEQSATWLAAHTRAPARRITVIPNPVVYPLESGPPHVDLATLRVDAGKRRVLLAVGRLDPAKGFDALIDAFAALAGEHPEWGLVILGEGGERARLQDRVRTHGLSGDVFLPGRAGNMGACYAEADAYALTSRVEGFPNSLLEAMAHGLPVVAVDCETGPGEIVTPEVDGLLVPPDDPAALTGALGRLLRDADLRRALGERAVDVRARFAVDRIAQRWERLLGAPAGAGRA